jgi:hypothetical protein
MCGWGIAGVSAYPRFRPKLLSGISGPLLTSSRPPAAALRHPAVISIVSP